MTSQRALWTFLILTLVGPLLAAVLAVLYTPLAIWANVAPFAAADHAHFDLGNLPDAGGVMQLVAQAGLRAFVWAPIAAAVTGICLVGLLLTKGQVGWTFAGIAGVIGFFFAYVVAPFDAGTNMLPVFAIAAGAVASGLSIFLERIGILPQSAG